MANADHTPAAVDLTYVRAELRIPASFEYMDDDALLAVAEEPEFYVECSALERELIVRLGAAWEVIRQMDAEAIERFGEALN